MQRDAAHLGRLAPVGLLLATIAVIFLGACTPAYDHIIRQAAVEHSCPRESIEVVEHASGIARLRVCGETRVYRRLSRSTWEDQTPDTLARDVPAWSDAGVRRFIGLLNEPVMDCTGGEPLVLRFVLDHDGRARDVSGLEEMHAGQRECIEGLLSRAHLTGRRRPRDVTVRLAPDGARSPDAPERTSGGANAGTAPDAFDTLIRSRLDEQAAAILTCTGTDSAALRFRYEPGATVRLEARDLDDDAIDECIRAAIGELAAPADITAGEGVHAVTR